MNGPQTWVGQSLIAMVCLIPGWLAIGFFSRNIGIRTDVFLAWYMLGVILAVAVSNASSPRVLLPGWWIVVSIVLIGVTFGGIANILLFRAVAAAPNPALAVAVAGVATPCVFLLSVGLAQWLPRYFDQARFDVWTFAGILLIIGGSVLITARR